MELLNIQQTVLQLMATSFCLCMTRYYGKLNNICLYWYVHMSVWTYVCTLHTYICVYVCVHMYVYTYVQQTHVQALLIQIIQTPFLMCVWCTMTGLN